MKFHFVLFLGILSVGAKTAESPCVPFLAIQDARRAPSLDGVIWTSPDFTPSRGFMFDGAIKWKPRRNFPFDNFESDLATGINRYCHTPTGYKVSVTVYQNIFNGNKVQAPPHEDGNSPLLAHQITVEVILTDDNGKVVAVVDEFATSTFRDMADRHFENLAYKIQRDLIRDLTIEPQETP